MRALALLVVAALAAPTPTMYERLVRFAQPFLRETSSHAASARGAAAYAKKDYAGANAAFARAEQLAPSSRNAFNLGTSEIAAGENEQGAAALSEAIKDPALRADALFNRGNSALAAKAFDRAIRDYADALRVQPTHTAAKRNLEIALNRRDEAQRQSQSGNKQNQQGSGGQQKQKQPNAPQQGQKPQPGRPDLEALLRSVQQQEQEELRRMKAAQAETRVGW